MIRRDVMWVERYRPTEVANCIFPKKLTGLFNGILNSEDKVFTNMIFHSSASGTGKTTVAMALCEETNHEYILINSSRDSGIDTLRTTVQRFASTVSFTSERKCIIFDEADRLNPNSTQPALRGLIEEFAGNCSFIFTCNDLSKIIGPLQSRCAVHNFTVPQEEVRDVKKSQLKSLAKILSAEKVSYDKKTLVDLVNRYFPDLRRCIHEVQAYANSFGKIDSGLLEGGSGLNSKDVEQITEFIKNYDYSGTYNYIFSNDYDSAIWESLYKHWLKNPVFADPKSLSEATYAISVFENNSAGGANPKLSLCGCMAQIMKVCKFVN